MTAILVLLALLSVATLASRTRYAAHLAHVVTTPLLLGVGVLLSPQALGVFTSSTQGALLPALRVGAAWLALLLGLRVLRPRADRGYALAVGATALFSGLAWLGGAAAAFGVLVATGVVEQQLGLGPGMGNRLDALGAAVLVGGLVAGTGRGFASEILERRKSTDEARLLLFIARHDDIIGAIAVLAAVWLWPLSPHLAPVYSQPGTPVLVVVGLGFTLFLAQAISQGGAMQHDPAGPPGRIALLGLLVFASGLSTGAFLPEAAIAFFFGMFIAAAGTGRGLLQAVENTERPVRLVVLILVGSHLGFDLGAVLVGVAVAVARMLAKVVLRWALSRGLDEPLPLASVLGSSGVAIPFALSFALARPEPLAHSQVLMSVCVAVSLADLLTLIAWRGTSSSEASGDAEGAEGPGPSAPHDEEAPAPSPEMSVGPA